MRTVTTAPLLAIAVLTTASGCGGNDTSSVADTPVAATTTAGAPPRRPGRQRPNR